MRKQDAAGLQNVADIYPLTPTQQGMLYHTLRDPGSEVYFEQLRCTFKGPFDVEQYQKAWEISAGRHPILRTAFIWDGLDTPLQIVHKTAPIPWELLDWSEAEGNQESLALLAREQRRQQFDLSSAPLLRMTAVQLPEEETHFIWNFHHLLLDGWSTQSLFEEVLAIYEMLVKGQTVNLPPVRPFRDYIAWLKKQDEEAADVFWRAALAGFGEPTPLNVQRVVQTEGIAYGEAALELEADLSKKLTALARDQRLTLNTMVQGAWAILLSRYSGESDVVFGNTLSGRPPDLPGVEEIVGMFINTLPRRVFVNDEEGLLSWLHRLQSQQLELNRYAYSSLARVQRLSDVPAGRDLFDSILVFENYPQAPPAGGRTVQVRDKRYHEISNYPLAILILPGEELVLKAIYNRNRFAAPAIAGMLDHLRTLLLSMVAQAQQTVGEMQLLTDQEREKLFVTWNDTARPVPDERYLHERAAAVAAQRPKATAVVGRDAALTYAELDAQVNDLAERLLARGLKPGTPVGLYVERSAAMLAGILGIMKAGGAYVPLDPTYPEERIDFIVRDTQMPLCVVQAGLASDVSLEGDRLLPLDLARKPRKTTNLPPVQLSPDHPAYIIYTSGSTGNPKGVVVSHRNLIASTFAREAYYDSPVKTFLLLSSFAFDSSVAGIFWTLVSGGTLIAPAADEEKDVQLLAALISKYGVTHTLALPSLYTLLLTYAPPWSLDSLRVVVVAGETCPQDLPALHFSLLPEVQLHNEYGPTEATVWCSVARLEAEDKEGPVPIGRPVANSRLTILNRRQQIVPPGVAGELVVGGLAVTPGYWQRPQLTAGAFPEITLGDGTRIGRVYRTGDLARWRADGQIEFLGRVDNQVKIRGHRVELGEIELLLAGHALVDEAIVIAAARAENSSVSGENLAAFVRPLAPGMINEDTVRQLKTYLERQLPAYMIPNPIVLLADLPRTPNGKLDRRKLRESLPAGGAKHAYAAPRTEDEKTLAAIWCDLLGLPQVGIKDAFFDLGGDSLLSIQAIARARQMGVNISARQFLREQTIERIAAVSAGRSVEPHDPGLVVLNDGDGRPPLFFLHGVFGDLAYVANIIPELADDLPAYGLQAHGLSASEEPDGTMEEMAARYVAEIRRVQATGPYYLTGFCYGGVIAYEVARQLEGAGEQVGLLAIIESSAPRSLHRSKALYHPQRLRTVGHALPSWARALKMSGTLSGEARSVPTNGRGERRLDDQLRLVDGDDDAHNLAELQTEEMRSPVQMQFREHSRKVSINYSPAPYGGHVTLIRAKSVRLKRILLHPLDPERGWGSLAGGGVSIHYVDGTHVGILKKPHAAKLAHLLNSILREAQSRHA